MSGGSSSRHRFTGSRTRVPALASTSITTSGVKLRKSPAVLDLLSSNTACEWLAAFACRSTGMSSRPARR